MLKLDPEIEEKLRKFGDEARVKPINRSLIPWPYVEGGLIIQNEIDIVFRDLRLEGLVTVSLEKGVGWSSQLMSLRGSVGMTACMILYFSKVLGEEPKIIHMDRDTKTNITDITAEWYREWWGEVELNWVIKMHEASGYRVEKIIQFKDVVEEARRFLNENYK
jgi:hypothetical protein